MTSADTVGATGATLSILETVKLATSEICTRTSTGARKKERVVARMVKAEV